MTKVELAWLAGFIDGEGCFMWEKSTDSVRISITNTHRPTLIYIQTMLGCGTVSAHDKIRNERHRAAWRFRVWGTNAIKVSKLIIPYLHEKREQANLLVRLYDMPMDKRRECAKFLTDMKHGRGKYLAQGHSAP